MKIDRITFRFLLVGVFNTLVGVSIMYLFYNALNLSYFISTASNIIVGSICSYYLNKYFTFESRGSSRKEIILFILNLIVCYILAYGISKFVIEILITGLNNSTIDNIAMLPGMVLYTVFNYIGQRYIVFER